jgi:hypothetical protein
VTKAVPSKRVAQEAAINLQAPGDAEQPLALRIKPRSDGALRWLKHNGTSWMVAWLLVAVATQIARIMSDYWLRWWVEDRYIGTNQYYIGVYTGICGAFIVLLGVRGVMFCWLSARGSLRSSKRFVTRSTLRDCR